MDGWRARTALQAGNRGNRGNREEAKVACSCTTDIYLRRVSRFPFITQERAVSLRVRDSLVESALRSRETAAVLLTTTVYNYQISAMILTSHSDATA